MGKITRRSFLVMLAYTALLAREALAHHRPNHGKGKPAPEPEPTPAGAIVTPRAYLLPRPRLIPGGSN